MQETRSDPIRTIDAHTAGEPLRLIVSGFPTVEGRTILEQREFVREHYELYDKLVTGLGNMFRPGVFEGSPTTYKLLEEGTNAYNTDWNNWAPSGSVAWRPNVQSGFLRTLLGDPDQATSGSGLEQSGRSVRAGSPTDT